MNTNNNKQHHSIILYTLYYSIYTLLFFTLSWNNLLVIKKYLSVKVGLHLLKGYM